MQKTSGLLLFGLLSSLIALFSSGCTTVSSQRQALVRAPITYAIVLHLDEREVLGDEARLNALSLARDTLLAAGIITPQDQMISDVERAQQLFRARVENGVLTEIAGVPSVSNATTVVLSQPRYDSGRVFWETSYPYGNPYPYDSFYASYPIPGPSWGYTGRNRDRYDRNDRNDKDHRDRDNRNDRDGKDGKDRGDRNRGDRGDKNDRNDRNDRDNRDRGNGGNRGDNHTNQPNPGDRDHRDRPPVTQRPRPDNNPPPDRRPSPRLTPDQRETPRTPTPRERTTTPTPNTRPTPSPAPAPRREPPPPPVRTERTDDSNNSTKDRPTTDSGRNRRDKDN